MPRTRKVTIQDLPDEMLERILLQLQLEDRKTALRVCKRWSTLRPFDMSSVHLVLHSHRFHEKNYRSFRRALLASSRPYKHVTVDIGFRFKHYDRLLEILRSFSGSMESLMLNFRLKPVDNIFFLPVEKEVRLEFFAEIVAMSAKLKHLHIDEGLFKSDGGGGLKFSPLNKLEELHLKNNLLTLVPKMQEITPNITKLHLLIDSEESLEFLRRVSSRLVELELWFLQENHFLAVGSMQFPLLEKVTISAKDDGNFEAVHGAMKQFIQQLHELKRLTLRNLRIYQVGNLFRSQSCQNIQVLCIGVDDEDSNLDAYDFRTICNLKQLKRLRIENAFINVPTVLDFPPLKGLHMLTLVETRIADHYEFDSFRQYAFPCVAIIELLDLDDFYSRHMFLVYDDICEEMPFMERITLRHDGTLVELRDLAKLCAHPGCRELRISCDEIIDMPPLKKHDPIPLERLVIEASNVSLNTLHKMITSMDNLKVLELAIQSRTIKPKTIRKLQDAFPRCEILLKKKVQIAEPL